MKKFWSSYYQHYKKDNFIEAWFKLFFMVVMCIIFSLFLPIIPFVFCAGFILSDPVFYFIQKYRP